MVLYTFVKVCIQVIFEGSQLWSLDDEITSVEPLALRYTGRAGLVYLSALDWCTESQ